MRNQYARMLFMPGFLVLISTFNFLMIKGSQQIEPLLIISLLVCGMGIGIFLVNLFRIIAMKKQNSN